MSDMTAVFSTIASMLRQRGCVSLIDTEIGELFPGAQVKAPSGKLVEVNVALKTSEIAEMIGRANEDEDLEYMIIVPARIASPSVNVRQKETYAERKVELWSRTELAIDVSEFWLWAADIKISSRQDYTLEQFRGFPILPPRDKMARFLRLTPDTVVTLTSPLDGAITMMRVGKDPGKTL